MTAVTRSHFSPVVTRDQLISAKVSGNDPSQSIQAHGAIVTISGVGANNGIMASSISLSFGGHSISVPVSKGQTAAQTQAAIAKALPKGYELAPLQTFMQGGTMFQIVKPGHVDVDASFQKARDSRHVSKTELTAIVKELKKDGFTSDEKDQLARAWIGLFDGASFDATKAAMTEYAKLQKQYDLPVYRGR